MTTADTPPDPIPTPAPPPASKRGTLTLAAMTQDTAEQRRLDGDAAAWRKWGPYLAERAWGTVREDYSPDGSAWTYFSHDHARSRAYRWNEDGLGGLCDDHQQLCFAVALWNERDPILKERLFGLSGPEGSHGEDVKEAYFYLDSTPTHSYLKMLYKYPQTEFPYRRLIEANAGRSKRLREVELIDTGAFAQDRYFDITIEYAKAAPEDILIRISVINRGPDAAPLHVLPTLWFRNTWSWGGHHAQRPIITAAVNDGVAEANALHADHHDLGHFMLLCEGEPERLFTENETNTQRLYNAPSPTPYTKDAFHDYVVRGAKAAVNPDEMGTKAAAHYVLTVAPGQTTVVRLRLSRLPWLVEPTGRVGPPAAGDGRVGFADFEAIFAARQADADAYYAALQPAALSDDLRRIQRQALAGMLWSKQFYYFDVADWLAGDPNQPPPPSQRKRGRNREWEHFNAADVLSMPDKWEYPWFAAWDTAFHCLPLALVDVQFAKDQLSLLVREWYQHPNGQVPAYEWNFADVNPPVLAWAAWRVYKIEKKQRGVADPYFLEHLFHKLMINFTWWVNRKDSEGNNVFQGGFLGLDNIGVFDRSAPLPTGGRIEQSDGTSWMGMFCLNMMTIALELAQTDRVYEEIATKFFEHFLYIAAAMNNIAGEGIPLWDPQDEFFYDVLHLPDGAHIPLKVRSLVGLIPLFAVETIEPDVLAKVPGFRERLEWFLEHRPHLAKLVSRWHEPGLGERRLLSLTRGSRMKRLLRRALDPNEFLSDFGIRSISRVHQANPYVLRVNGTDYVVRYEPAESQSWLFGGNSNWRGPIWFPINYLLIESLQKFYHYYGDDFKVECPTGSGRFMTISQVADVLSQRLIRIFMRGSDGQRPFNGANQTAQHDPHWRDLVLFHEYFHGDTGEGLGASHQTGWTGLVAKLIQQQGESR
jgi:hypothetical protein